MSEYSGRPDEQSGNGPDEQSGRTQQIGPDGPGYPSTEASTDTADTTDRAGGALPVASDGWDRSGHGIRRGIRIRTVVFGLILLAISASCLVTMLSTVTLDATAVTVAVLIGAGGLLVAGALAAAVREARGGPGS